MSFTLPDNPHIKPDPPKRVMRRFESDGRTFEETGEFRPAKKGEYIVGPMSSIFGPAVAKRDTEESYSILREVKA